MRRSLGTPRVLLLAGLGLLLAGGAIWRTRVEVVPAWSIQVLDEGGQPVPGMKVSESWEFYGAFLAPRGNDTRLTDAYGRAAFPAQYFSASKAGLLAARGVTLLIVHASFGPSGSVSILPPQGYKHGRSSYQTNKKIHDDPGFQTTREQGGLTTIFRFVRLDFFDFAYNQDWAEMKRILAADPATVNLRDRTGVTPLIVLSQFGYAGPNAEMIGRLLEGGAEINAQTRDGTTALHNAAKNYAVAYMEFLLARGADPTLRIHDSVYYTTNGFTPLHFLLGAYDSGLADASAGQKIKGIDVLLAHGADINARDSTGASPLHLAAVWGDPEIVAALLSRGADPLAKNSAGQTPLASITELNDTPEVHQLRELLLKAAARKPPAQP